MNDDTDVVPAKREPLFLETFKNKSPSVMQKVETPAQSNLGGYDCEDQKWNNTVFSNYEYNMY